MKKLLKNTIIYIATLLLLCSCTNLGLKDVPQKQDEESSKSDEYPVFYDLSIGYWDVQDIVDTDDEILKIIEDRFNMNITLVNVSWGDYLERYLIMAATGKLPDVFSANVTRSSTYWDWVKQGIIRALPSDMDNYPNVQDSLSLPEAKLLMIDGYNYCIPRTAFLDEDLSFSDVGLLVRRDWMDELGIDNPTNFEEFSEMLTRFTLDDPDGDGKDNTSGISVNNRYALGKWIMLTLHPDCNTYSWVRRDGAFVPSFMTEDFLDIVQALDHMYETKALDQDFAIQRVNEATQKFADGYLGALEYKSATTAIEYVASFWNESQPDKDFAECVDLLPVFPALDGNIYRNVSISYWSESLISSSVDDGKVGRILALYDFLLSKEGSMLTKYGIMEKDYTYNDGEITVLRELDGEGNGYSPLSHAYPSVRFLSTLTTWGISKQDFVPNDINNAAYGEDVVNMSHEAMVWTLNNTIPMDRPVEFMTLASMGSNEFTTTRVVDDLTRVILSSDDAIQAWKQVVSEYKAEGIDEMIFSMNELAKEYGLK